MGIDISEDLERLDKKPGRLKSGEVFDIKAVFPSNTSIAPDLVEDANANRAYDVAEKAKLENPYHLTMKEIDSIYDAIDEKYKNSPLLRQRARTMITVAYGMGLRSSEYTKAGATKTDYTLKTSAVLTGQGAIKRKIIVKGKGSTKTGDIKIPGKERTVNMSGFVADEIRAWINIRLKYGVPVNARYLFPAMDGETFKGADSAFAYTTFDKELKQLAEIAGIDKRRMHSHIFRHSYGTHLASLGYPPEVIAAELGHSDVSTTRKYYIHVEEMQRTSQVQGAGEQIFRGQIEAAPVVPGAPTQVAPVAPAPAAAYNDAFPSQGNMRAVVDGAINKWSSGAGTINELQNDLRQSGVELSPDEMDIVQKEAQERRLHSLEGEQARRSPPSKGTFVVSHDNSALREQGQAVRAPSTFTGGASIGPDDIAIDFKNDKDARRGARLVLKVAVDKGVNIHQAYNIVVDSFEAAHYQLGDPEARKAFRERTGKLFPYGLGRAGQRDLIAVGEDWGGTSQKQVKPRIFSSSGYESHIIAQHLLDEGLLEDIDPADFKGKRPGLYAAAEAGVFRDSKENPIPGDRIVKTNEDGSKEFKTRGGKQASTWIGNILTRLEEFGGQRKMVGIQRDKYGNSRVVRDNDSDKRYPYGHFNPSKEPTQVGDSLSGYGVTEKGKKEAAKLDLNKQKLGWVGAVASDAQKEFFEDMRLLEYHKQKVTGLPEVAQNTEAARKHGRIIIGIENKYSVEIDVGNGPEKVLFSALPSPMEGYNPETTNKQIKQHLQESTGRKNVTNKEVEKFKATQQAMADAGIDETLMKRRDKIRENTKSLLERKRNLYRAGKAGLFGFGVTIPLAVGSEEAMARRQEEATGEYDPDYLKALIEPPSPPIVQGLRDLLTPKQQKRKTPSERIAQEIHVMELEEAEAAGRKYEKLELVPARDAKAKRREEAQVELTSGGTKSPPVRNPLSFMSDEDLLTLGQSPTD